MAAFPLLPGRPLTPDEVDALPTTTDTIGLAIPWFGRVTDDGVVVTGMLVAVGRHAFATGFDPARSAWIDLGEFPAWPDGEALSVAIRSVRAWLTAHYPDEPIVGIRSRSTGEA